MLQCNEKQTMFLELFHWPEGLHVELETWTKMKTFLRKNQIGSFIEKKKKSAGENISGLFCHGKDVSSSLEMFQRLLCMNTDTLALTSAHI